MNNTNKIEKTARIGIDIGGTFTDFVFHDQDRGITRTGKRLTTPENPSKAIIEGILRLLEETGTAPQQVKSIVHGTTLITNTVLERTGARIGLLTTAGVRDVLEMGRESRYDVDDLMLPPIPVLVPRNMRIGVRGRLRADGNEHQPLDEEEVRAAAKLLVEHYKIEALAISFLHSYCNTSHEERAYAIIKSLYPHLLVSLSSHVSAELREYERTCTACVNAYVQPKVHSYMDKLRDELYEIGVGGDLFIMLSGGGITTIEDAKQFPVRLIESGPAAGAMAAAYVARQLNESKILSFDMGGTTAKMCLIEDGKPHVKHDFEAGRTRRYMQGSGLPLQVTVVDMIEIGSGGGSIASIDEIGLMKVGPRSASSVPGPVSYGRGGSEPTVTDADLLLGCLDPQNFLGGEIELSIDKVRTAIESKLGNSLKLGASVVARGIQEIIDENMAAATRMHMAEKGMDPREYTMLAFGGAGPVHAYRLAKLLNIRRVVVPMGAGVYSAFGFLVAQPAVDQVRGYVTPLESIDWNRVNRLYADMQNQCEKILLQTGATSKEITWKWTVDMRYVGQGFEISVPITTGPLDAGDQEHIQHAFVNAYIQRFSRCIKGVGIEAVNWRLRGALGEQEIDLNYTSSDSCTEPKQRTVYFSDYEDVEAKVYDRYSLKPGFNAAGPAVIQERESSCSIGPDAIFTIDAYANLIIEIASSDGARH